LLAWGPFGPSGYFKGNLLALGQGLKTCAIDGCVVNEDITLLIFPLNKTESLFCIEPFNCTLFH
jgi:hypothetical protein